MMNLKGIKKDLNRYLSESCYGFDYEKSEDDRMFAEYLLDVIKEIEEINKNIDKAKMLKLDSLDDINKE